jgi:hypothetical protein
MANHEEDATRTETTPANGGPPPGAGRTSRWGDVAVGTIVEAEQASMRVLGVLRRGMAQRGRRLSGGAVAGTDGVRRRINELAERGAAERVRGRARAAAGLDTALAALVTSPVLGRMVDAQLNRVLRPVVNAVLDTMADLLEQEPERVRAMVRTQRGAMVDEVLTRVRSGDHRLPPPAAAHDQEPAPPGEPR